MNFFKVLPDFSKIMQKMTKSEIVVLIHLSLIMDYNNSILWDRALQETVSSVLGIGRHTLQNNISSLCSKGLLRRDGFQIFVNSDYMKKGR